MSGLGERFWSKVDTSGECWIWTAYLNECGYGRFKVGGKRGIAAYAHRLTYEEAHGTIPAGLQIDHLCRTRGCVIPDHLEAVAQAENWRRGMAPSAIAARSDRCKRGHEFTLVAGGPRRYCKTCARERRRDMRAAL